MSPGRSARARLARLLVEVRAGRGALDDIVRELERFRPDLDAPEPDRPILALFASDLHDYYTAVETLFERVARILDGEVPSGAESHRELVDQMAAEVPPLRSALIDEDLRKWLHDLRRLRHFVRHAYAVHLSADRLREHAAAVAARHPELQRALDLFFDFVRRSRDAMPDDEA